MCLKLGRLLTKGLQVGNPIGTGPSGNQVMEGQRAQGGEATGARPADHQPPAINLARLNQGAGRVEAIGDVEQAPLAGAP
jgi:hypothetical protein